MNLSKTYSLNSNEYNKLCYVESAGTSSSVWFSCRFDTYSIDYRLSLLFKRPAIFTSGIKVVSLCSNVTIDNQNLKGVTKFKWLAVVVCNDLPAQKMLKDQFWVSSNKIIHLIIHSIVWTRKYWNVCSNCVQCLLKMFESGFWSYTKNISSKTIS